MISSPFLARKGVRWMVERVVQHHVSAIISLLSVNVNLEAKDAIGRKGGPDHRGRQGR